MFRRIYWGIVYSSCASFKLVWRSAGTIEGYMHHWTQQLSQMPPLLHTRFNCELSCLLSVGTAEWWNWD